jgi:heptaprenyl diphosphate synthase
VSGKTPGTDLREGVATLPVLYALRSPSPADARLRELVSGPLTDDSLHAEALRRLRASTALAEARNTLRGYADASRAMLSELPARPARDALEALTDVVVARTS